MTTKIQKWGNSQGLRMAKHILEQAQIHVGDEVDVMVVDGTIVIKPLGPRRGKKSLKELVAKMPAKYVLTKEEWGGPTGKEVW